MRQHQWQVIFQVSGLGNALLCQSKPLQMAHIVKKIIIWRHEFPLSSSSSFVRLTSCCSLQILHSHMGLVLLLLQIPHLLQMCCEEANECIRCTKAESLTAGAQCTYSFTV